MINSPLVSILIPNYNKSVFLKDTLDSIINQTYKNWECIIVDDHSTDSSWQILQEYAVKDSRFKIFKRPKERKPGGNAARNYAFELSEGEFISWFDSDDLMVNVKIENQLNSIISNNSDFVISKLRNLDENLPYKEFIFENNVLKRPIKYLKGSFWFGTPVPLFKKSFLKSFDKLFDEHLKRNQEAEFFIRILHRKPNISFLNEFSVLRRFDENSILSKYQKLNEKEKLDLGFPAFSSMFNSFKKYDFLEMEEKEFFIKWFIYFIQYSRFNWAKLRFAYVNTLKVGTNPQKILVTKSLLYRLLNGK
jgi:glycosyltransferase involved in cell wall biosynthesis